MKRKNHLNQIHHLFSLANWSQCLREIYIEGRRRWCDTSYMHLISSYGDDCHLHHQHRLWCWWWYTSSSSTSSMVLMMTMTMRCGMTLLLHLIQALALDSLPLNSSPLSSSSSYSYICKLFLVLTVVLTPGTLQKPRLCILASGVSVPGTQLQSGRSSRSELHRSRAKKWLIWVVQWKISPV